MPYVSPTPEPYDAYSGITPPIHVHLEPLTLAPLGKPMRLCLTVMSTVDAPNTRVFFTLPNDVIVSKGLTEKTLILPADIPKVFEIEIQALSAGIKKIEAEAQSVEKDGSSWGDFAWILLDVSETETVVREDPPPSEIEGDQPLQTVPLIPLDANNLRFTGNNRFREVDGDNNGLFEALVVTVEVQTSTAGDYSISGFLHKGIDSIANRPAYESALFTDATFTGGAGTHTVDLAFSGEQIYRSGRDGPYTLSVEGIGPARVAAHADFNTPAFTRTRFGEAP